MRQDRPEFDSISARTVLQPPGLEVARRASRMEPIERHNTKRPILEEGPLIEGRLQRG